MLLDMIALLLLGVFALLGAWRGALASGAGLVTLVLSYTGGVFAASHFGAAASTQLGLHELLGPAVAGTAGFALTFIVCGAISMLLKRWAERRRDGYPRGGGDRFLGAIFGGVRGSLLVLLLAWLVIWLDAGRELGAITDISTIPRVSSSHVARLTGAVVETAVEAVLVDAGPGARVAARIAGRPAEALGSVDRLLQDERIERVQADQLFWRYVESGAVDAAVNRRSFYELVYDAEMRAQLADLGLVSQAAARDPEVFRAELADVLREVGPRIGAIRPELTRLALDPEIQSLLESGDTLGLVGHPRVRELVSKASVGL